MKHTVLALILVASMLPALPSRGQITSDIAERCSRGHGDAAIRACTIIIHDVGFGGSDNVWGAYIDRAAALDEKGDYVDAIADYDRAVELRPNDPSGLTGRCGARMDANVELDLALADCSRSLEIRPRFSTTLLNRALVLLRMNRIDDAIRDFDAVIPSDDQIPDFP